MDLFTLKQQIYESAQLGALGVIQQLYPALDEVKYAEACIIAGSERWLKWHIKQGHIKGVRRGPAKNSPIYYSRLEIAALKRAEAELNAKLL